MVGAGDLACQLDRDVAAGHRQSCVAQERRNRTDSATGRIENDYGEHEMPERQVSLQELESKLDSYIHDVGERCDGRREPCQRDIRLERPTAEEPKAIGCASATAAA